MILFDNPVLFIIIIMLTAVTIIAISFSVVAIAKYSELNKKYEIFMSGRDAETLEEYFIDLQKDIDHLVEDNKKNKESIRKRAFGLYQYRTCYNKSKSR